MHIYLPMHVPVDVSLENVSVCTSRITPTLNINKNSFFVFGFNKCGCWASGNVLWRGHEKYFRSPCEYAVFFSSPLNWGTEMGENGQVRGWEVGENGQVRGWEVGERMVK